MEKRVVLGKNCFFSIWLVFIGFVKPLPAKLWHTCGRTRQVMGVL